MYKKAFDRAKNEIAMLCVEELGMSVVEIKRFEKLESLRAILERLVRSCLKAQ